SDADVQEVGHQGGAIGFQCENPIAEPFGFQGLIVAVGQCGPPLSAPEQSPIRGSGQKRPGP
ncbi:MAG: hypothetical protein ACREMY_21405, partial [bacterium]